MTAGAVSLERELADLLVELRGALEELRRDRSDVLDTAGVCARYGLQDARTARAIMRETGGAFMVARRLLVHRATLEAWELAQAGPTADEPAAAAAPSARSRRRATVLPPGFWRHEQP